MDEIRKALAQWDSSKKPPEVEFNEVLTMRARALENLIEVCRRVVDNGRSRKASMLDNWLWGAVLVGSGVAVGFLIHWALS